MCVAITRRNYKIQLWTSTYTYINFPVHLLATDCIATTNVPYKIVYLDTKLVSGCMAATTTYRGTFLRGRASKELVDKVQPQWRYADRFLYDLCYPLPHYTNSNPIQTLNPTLSLMTTLSIQKSVSKWAILWL